MTTLRTASRALLLSAMVAAAAACGASQDLGDACTASCQARSSSCGGSFGLCNTFCSEQPGQDAVTCLAGTSCADLETASCEICGVSLLPPGTNAACGGTLPSSNNSGFSSSDAGTQPPNAGHDHFADDGGNDSGFRSPDTGPDITYCTNPCQSAAGLCASEGDGGFAAQAATDCARLCSALPSSAQVQCLFFSSCGTLVSALEGKSAICGISPNGG